MPESSTGKTARRPRPATSRATKPTRSKRELWAAGATLLAIAVCAGLILWATGGFFNKGFGVAFFICAALFAGIGFWAFTPTDDKANTFKSFGFRLAGGAAVGFAFAWFAWKLVDDLPQYAVVQLPSDVKTDGLRVLPGNGVRSAETFIGRDGALLYVVFSGNAPTGTVTLRWFDTKSETATGLRTLVVDRKGSFNE